MVNPIRITRNQLKAIIGDDEEAIKQFERLFSIVNSFVETGVEESLIVNESQSNKALKQCGLLDKRLTAIGG